MIKKEGEEVRLDKSSWSLVWTNFRYFANWDQNMKRVIWTQVLHMHICPLTPPHLLSSATWSPSFKSLSTTSPGLNLAQHLSAFYLHWWSQPLKQPRRHPHPSPTFLSVSLPRACTMALLGRAPRTVFVRSPLQPHPPFIGVCAGTVSEWVRM